MRRWKRQKQLGFSRSPAARELFYDIRANLNSTTILKSKACRRPLNAALWSFCYTEDFSAGETINGLGLARKLNVSVAALRDYLNRFERFGLVQRQPNTSWKFNGFTEKFAVELFEVRELFEARALAKFAGELDLNRLRVLTDLEQEHRMLLAQIDERFHDFSALDVKFHRTFADSADNRFISQLQELISLIFHYHFQWNKVDERERNAAAILEHLDIIAALRSGDRKAVAKACERHMVSAHQTLVRSLKATSVTNEGRPAA